MTPEEAKRAARAQCGVMLPDVDPTIGELVIATFMANPMAQVGDLIAGLVSEAPAEIRGELANACLELLLCKEKGKLYWIDVDAQSILVGARPMVERQALTFGVDAHWPMAALLCGPPKSAVIRMSNGARRVWLAAEPMDGTVVRQSEAVALGNAMIEAFGGRIIEDRQGPEVMQQSFIEQNMTQRAKNRAGASDAVERMSVIERAVQRDAHHARVALAEALPGSLEPGARLRSEDQPDAVYEVERRVNESWVVIVSVEPGAKGNAEPCAWVAEAEDAHGPFGSDGPPHWGFTEEPAIAMEGDDDSEEGSAAPEGETAPE